MEKRGSYFNSMNIIYETKSGKIVNNDNLDALKEIDSDSIDSCISDFPYAIEFMSKSWDSSKSWHDGSGSHSEFKGTGYSGKRRPNFYLNTREDMLYFYNWCFDRGSELYRVMKSGAYVAIFGFVKTNHRMKCAFEDCGFIVVDDIDWIYLSGMPHNQDVGKMFDAAGNPELAQVYKDWKTAGLKPAHETVTIFQKPMIGTYIENIEKFGVGAMNIGACRVPISQEDIDMLNAKASKNPTTAYSDKDDKIYGKYALDMAVPANPDGRFPPNIVIDDGIAKAIDAQTGITKSTGGSGIASTTNRARHIYGAYNQETNENYQNESLGGYGDVGGGSRLFPIFKYNSKVSPSERMLPDGTRNPHVTLKPVDLIKWIIKLITPKDGITIDITAGSCTHAVACEELNIENGYNLKYIDIELCNDEENPYCEVGKQRVEAVVTAIRQKRLF